MAERQTGLAAVRHADPDRYLSLLYAPSDLRDDLAALYAFNAEIAAVRERVSEPLPGEVRLQWWRDILATGTAGQAGPGPLGRALLETIERHRLPVSAFQAMLDARIFDLYDDPMPSRGDFEGYAGETAAALIQLAGLVLEPEAAPAFADAAGHAGCAQAVAGTLRMLPIHRARGQCYVPLDLLEAAGTSREALLAGRDEAALGRMVAAMVALGREHWSAFLRHAHAMPASLRPAFLAAGLAPAYLERLAAAGTRAAHRTVDIGILRRHGTMLHRAARGW